MVFFNIFWKFLILIFEENPRTFFSLKIKSSEKQKCVYKLFLSKSKILKRLNHRKLQFCKFSDILCLCKILDFDRFNLYAHFCFSELLILREKRFADFLLGHWSTKKNTHFQKILKKHHAGELHKRRYNISPGAANHTFF